MHFMSSTSLCKPLMVGTHLFFTTGPGLAFGGGAVPEGGETGTVNMSMVVEGCAISGMVGNVMGTVGAAMAVEGCAISGTEVCDVEAFTVRATLWSSTTLRFLQGESKVYQINTTQLRDAYLARGIQRENSKDSPSEGGLHKEWSA